MKVVFITSTFDHYHLPSCEEAYKQLGSDFIFITTLPMPDSMKELGFTDYSRICPYVLNAWESTANLQSAKQLCNDADVVIIGAADKSFVSQRLKKDKLTFCFSERLFKKGMISLFRPKNALNLYLSHTRFRNNNNYYILCAGYYAAKDFQIIGMKPNKLLRWGYFSATTALTNKYDRDFLSILWTGRFVKLKHPEFALEAAKQLKLTNIKFQLNFIGMGPLQIKMQKYIDKNQLNDEVKILGSMPTADVHRFMSNCDVSLFTSDKREGWGAVVNEAMIGGCAVIASDAAGSSKVLINHNQTGLLYHHPNKEEFINHVLFLANNPSLRKQMGIQANKSMTEEWNGIEGMKRILSLSRSILNNQTIEHYTDGPCSIVNT